VVCPYLAGVLVGQVQGVTGELKTAIALALDEIAVVVAYSQQTIVSKKLPNQVASHQTT
jgi:hypothetical protein